MENLKVGMLGAGGIAKAHGRSLTALSEVELVAVCDIVPDRAAAFSREFTGGAAAAYEDFDRMLDETRLDALYVCLPPFAHCGQAERAAEKGVNLFLEKPIAIEPRRAAEITRAVEAAGVVSQVGYMSRFGHAVRKLKGAIEDGSAGRPTLFQGQFSANSLHSEWWRDVEKSGGQVLEQAIHTYDLALHFLGEAAIASGFAGNLCHGDVPDYTVEDTSISAVLFENGAVAGIAASNCAIPNEWTSSFRVVCEKVTATFASVNDAELAWTAEDDVRRETVSADVNVMMEETLNFIAAVRGEARPMSPVREGLRGVELTWAVLESARRGGRPIPVGGAGELPT